MPSRAVPFGVKPRTWSATSSPRKPSMGSPASNPYAPTPRACWIPAANTGVLKTVSTTFATSPLMKIARASAVAQAPRSWPPFAISPYRFSASPELATSPQHFAAVLVRAIPSSFASSGCDFDVAVATGTGNAGAEFGHGHPAKGTFLGEWGPNGGTQGRLMVLMDWDGKAITGTINPGPQAMPITKAELNPDNWTLHLESGA